MSDLLTPESIAPNNTPAYSVSELAGALKRTLETTYDHVRVRAEISKVTRHSSGHVYLTLKDDKAAIDGVIWKGQVSRLNAQPEMGLEVIVTGKITTFPASSKYQIVIESMEAAGIGALLAQLEKIKLRLKSEGLFETARKKPLPYAPKIIGVITSPTGAVIRDILHRIRDRWPCRVIVWPVVVQGADAAPQVIRALNGFCTDPVLPRPDVVIIARGGGSVEDLWPFNDESLARAVAASPIPVISAVGHETDTTLIDFVSDRRAPTPTGAAEMATPVIGELRAFVADLERRRQGQMTRLLDQRRERVAMLSRALPDPNELLNTAQQRLDFAAHRLDGALHKAVTTSQTALIRISGRFHDGLMLRPQEVKAQTLEQLSIRALSALKRKVDQAKTHARLPENANRMKAAILRSLSQKTEKLQSLEALRVSLNPDRPLELGFARVGTVDGHLISHATDIEMGARLTLTFKDGTRLVDAVDEGTPPKATLARKKPEAPPSTPAPKQGSLF